MVPGPPRSFSVKWDKKISGGKTWYPPPHLSSMIFFHTRNFLKHRRVPFPYEVFRHCETKKIRQNRDAPPPMHKNFRYQNFFQTQGFPYEVFWHCETKKIRQNRDPPPLPCMKIFDTRFFSKHRRVPVRIFLALWDKKNSTKPWSPPPMHENFRYQIFFRNTEGFPYEFFWHCETKKFQLKIVISLSYVENFSLPEVSWIPEKFPCEFLRYREAKNFERSLLYKIRKSVVELMFVENLRKLDFKL